MCGRPPPARSRRRHHCRASPPSGKATGAAARSQADRSRGPQAARRGICRLQRQAVRVPEAPRRRADQQRKRADTEAVGDLSQSDEWVPLRVGREDLRRPLLYCRNRPPQRPERPHRHPRRPGTTRRPGSRRATSPRGVSNYDVGATAMAETKYVMDALSRLSQDTTIDLASRSDVGKWSIEHFLEQAGSNRLGRWRLLLLLDDEITSRTT